MLKFACAAIAAVLLVQTAHAQEHAPIKFRAVADVVQSPRSSGYRLNRALTIGVEASQSSRRGVSFDMIGSGLFQSSSSATTAGTDILQERPTSLLDQLYKERLDIQHDAQASKVDAIVELGVKYRF